MTKLKPQYIVVKATKVLIKGKNKSVSGNYLLTLDDRVMNMILKDIEITEGKRVK